MDIKMIRVPIPTPTLWPHTSTNCYLIGNDQESLLIDAGYDQLETKLGLEQAIKDHGLATPKSILLTHAHPDHAPGVRQLVDWSPSVFCHWKEQKAVLNAIYPMTEVTTVDDGDSIRVAEVDVVVFHAPGHTAGHLNFYLPSKKVLFAGDNILSEGTTWIGKPDGDMTDYIQSLKRLQTMNLVKLGPGHGDWVVSPQRQIDFVLNRRLMRETQIKELIIKYKQLTSTKLTELIYQDNIHPSVFEVARRTTEAHLLKLIKDGYIIQDKLNYLMKP
ncbi:Glyoxylase, beta-lactamase superfamily II [Mesobacillus persicus]|uniref:Glyoxylase, beta-lactamase superfamily II n=1 Tax=Mesobacillus persicus TaxID=930146 RepID=A0A1H7W1T8_9BACI|nr:MBL fold metallo-hydrolase [Mesobacillus persicus]SEM15451.1 Glyoxylase, beta-lactamase superfamily II [Mesobacillus persicus]